MSIMRVRTAISGTQGLPGLFTMYFLGSTTTPSTIDAADVCARVRAFLNSIPTVFPNTVTLQVSGDVDILDPAVGVLVGALSVSAPAAVSGTSPSELPAATALLLQHNTGVVVGGRRQKGRSFLSPAATAIMSAGLPTSAIRTSVATAANVMRTGTTTSVPCVWHRPSPPLAGNGFVTPTSNFTVSSTFAVLRSRRD